VLYKKIDFFFKDCKIKSIFFSYLKKMIREYIFDLSKYEFADCCKPLPGDEVVGFKDFCKDKLIVHKANCPTVKTLPFYLVVRLKWNVPQEIIVVEGVDSKGILLKIVHVISDEMNLNIIRLNITTQSGIFKGEIGISINDLISTNILLSKIIGVYGVLSVYRKSSTIKKKHAY